MRRLSLLLLVAAVVAALLAVSRPATARGPFTARGVVTRAVDGETLAVRLASGKQERVRVVGVDAPTGAECYAKQSTARLSALTRGRRVTILAEGAAPSRDAARRLLGYVRLSSGADVGRVLIADGAAQADTWGRVFARFPTYAATQLLAEKNVTGSWKRCGTDVSVAVDAAEPAAAVGGAAHYTLTVANRGDVAAPHVSVDLRPPPDESFASLPGECTSAGWHATCVFGDLAPRASAEVRFAVTLNKTGVASVRAAATFTTCVRAPCGGAPVADANRDNDTAGALVLVVKELVPGAAPPSVCDPSYPSICLPSPPPDLDCNDIPFRGFYVRRDLANSDPHRLDQSEDGIGCQFDDY